MFYCLRLGISCCHWRRFSHQKILSFLQLLVRFSIQLIRMPCRNFSKHTYTTTLVSPTDSFALDTIYECKSYVFVCEIFSKKTQTKILEEKKLFQWLESGKKCKKMLSIEWGIQPMVNWIEPKRCLGNGIGRSHTIDAVISYTNPQTPLSFFPKLSVLFTIFFTAFVSLHRHFSWALFSILFFFLRRRCRFLVCLLHEYEYECMYFFSCANVKCAPTCPIEYFPIIYSGAIGFW